MAGVAQHFDVRQEAHFDGAQALAFADRAAALARVEREARGSPSAYARITRVGKQLAHVIPETHIGGRAGAGRLADGCLVHFEHTVDMLPSGYVHAAPPDWCCSR